MAYKENIKKLRNEMILKKEEFAKYLGVPIVSVARWGTRVNKPTIKIKRKLSLLFIKYGIVED